MIKERICLLTNDVETTSIWHNNLRDETGWKVYREGLPILLAIYKKYNIKSTFFITGYIAKLVPDIVKLIQNDGHEIGSHGLEHDPNQAFDRLSLDEQTEHLKKSKELLEDISGAEVISFRAPAGRVMPATIIALQKTGFKIDSSVSSQRFDMFMSFGNIMKLRWLCAPRNPYFTANNNLFKSGDGSILEIPVSALIYPYISTTMRIFPNFTKSIRHLLHFENSLTGKPIVFLIHPNEFIDESNEEYFGSRRTDNFVSYIFGDVLRRKLKIKNLGVPAISLYDNQIKFFKERHYKFLTLKEYYLNIN